MIDFLNWLDGVLWGLPLIVLMIVTGLYFTVRSGFFQFRRFGWIMKRTGGQIFAGKTSRSGAEGKGMLSPFEAISTAVGGTVGFGNIAGMATAVAAGGPGAILWMWATACLGLIIKQVEVTLGCYYRRTDENGDSYGGPTYYMEYGLGKERGWGKLWLIPAIIFSLAMILANLGRVPAAVLSIFRDAFTGTAAVGGFAGAAVSQMIRIGMARAVYSNEAGWGTSPMVHSSAKTRHPVEQGLWGSFEVFFDTLSPPPADGSPTTCRCWSTCAPTTWRSKRSS